MILPLVVIVAVAAFLLGSPGEALAWGPVTHLVHGSMLLERLPLLPEELQLLLARFPYEYLYGCIGADIIQAKKFTRSLYTHCHHWQTGSTRRATIPSAPFPGAISPTSPATPSRTTTISRSA